MNLILFNTAAEAEVIAANDPRAKHIREVLRLGVGDPIYVGVVDGVRGLGKIVESLPGGGVRLDVAWEKNPPITHPIRLLVGVPRPQTARRVLFDAACLGVMGLDFFQAEKGEPSYAKSKLWSTDEWRERLWQGAEQGFATQLPPVQHFKDLAAALEDRKSLAGGIEECFALDVYEGVDQLSALNTNTDTPTTLAIGAERGWSAKERDQLRAAGFQLASLGERVLRTESACQCGVSVLLAGWGRM
ncbi:16S rRNA (uracil(1498)-N(3))-methyltransferase [Cerasicoccus arenae]|uniref:Ribosomal RNA small subunit methyltransferase E n=1 Tax=Cerasicoccus arenae TaxID=424488 RepID=A0A8J3GCI7_9BACT|nr:RsmE family RNA methyltransferase [Cerasicoccus arenae]MBK1856918.1 16S rRNA (uracil(1498)-N(3))-methyltransferase [Cerasicoccus arenae]GHB89842.1 ribosomal RNA small subunit methyltransferase E [Cerasicoccus arenae]